MKLSIIAASLLLSAPIIAYTQNNFNGRASLNKPSFSALRYQPIEEEIEIVEMPYVFGLVDLTSALSTKEDPAIAALAASMGVSDEDVRLEYAKWVMRYAKPAHQTHYPTFKKNILLMAQYNHKHEHNFWLNENGDFIEGSTSGTGWGATLPPSTTLELASINAFQ
jgi:hypothetical protein